MLIGDFSPGSSIGRYVVRSLLGRGSFSEVLLADDPVLDAPVAIKLLSQHASHDVELRHRFVREARFMRGADSRRVATVFDLDEYQGRPYFVMEAFAESLASRIERFQKAERAVDGVLRLVDELASCLHDLKAADLVHRDLKPSNLMIRNMSVEQEPSFQVPTTTTSDLLATNEMLVVVDLGLAKDLRSSAITLGAGTPGFMAPEQQRPGNLVDHRSDIYSATVVVCEIAKLAGIDCPNLDAVLRRGTAHDIEERSDDIDEWASSLRAALMPASDVNPQPVAGVGLKTCFWQSAVRSFVIGAVVVAAAGVLGLALLPLMGPGDQGRQLPSDAGATLSSPSVSGEVDPNSPSSAMSSRSPQAASPVECLDRPSELEAGEGASGWVVEGETIRGADGYPVLIRGVEWPGLNKAHATLSGLEARSLVDLLDQIAMLGFNTIRIPFDPSILTEQVKPSALDVAANPDFASASAAELLDCLVAGAVAEGLAVILALDTVGGEGGPGPATEVGLDLAVIDVLVERYRGWPNVVGIDLAGSANESGCWSCSAASGDDAVEAVVNHLDGRDTEWLVFTPDPPLSSDVGSRVVWAPRVDPPSVVEMPAAIIDGIVDDMALRPTVVVGFGELPGYEPDLVWLTTCLRQLEGRGGFGFVLRSLHSNEDLVGGILAPDGFSVKQSTMDELGRFFTGPFRVEAFSGVARSDSSVDSNP